VVAISNAASLGRGESASLACVGFGDTELEILWSFNGAPVVNTSQVTIYEENVIVRGTIFKQSVLQICRLKDLNAGDFTCVVTDGVTTANATTKLLVKS
jgi:accessory colonization factor AcfC